jgi:hypothetical protein
MLFHGIGYWPRYGEAGANSDIRKLTIWSVLA